MDDPSSSPSRPSAQHEPGAQSPPGDVPPSAVPAPGARRQKAAGSLPIGDSDEKIFLELRRKVQSSELLSAATEKLLGKIRFNGHLTVVVQHGRVVKSGYEEGYFRRSSVLGGVLFESNS